MWGWICQNSSKAHLLWNKICCLNTVSHQVPGAVYLKANNLPVLKVLLISFISQFFLKPILWKGCCSSHRWKRSVPLKQGKKTLRRVLWIHTRFYVFFYHLLNSLVMIFSVFCTSAPGQMTLLFVSVSCPGTQVRLCFTYGNCIDTAKLSSLLFYFF